MSRDRVSKDGGEDRPDGRVVYVLRYYPTLTETFVHAEIQGLSDGGIPVGIAAFDDRGDPGARPLALPTWRQPHRWGWLPALGKLAVEWLRCPGRVPARVLWLATVLRGARHIHVHFAGEAAAWTRLACHRVGVPYTVTVHAVDLFKPRPELPAILQDAAEVLTISTYNQVLLRERYSVNTTLIRCGVAIGTFWRDTPDDPPVILLVGRFVEKKGVDVLVEAFRGLERRAALRLVSNAPAFEVPGVTVVGLLPPEGVRAELRRATVFALPCRRAPDGDLDGLPVAILEAMASGLPVVTTNVSGIPEVVDETVGWVVPADDVEALRTALRAALDAPEEAEKRGAAGRERAKGFTIEAQVETMRRVVMRGR